jgi:hypothetical protein
MDLTSVIATAISDPLQRRNGKCLAVHNEPDQ